MRYIQARGALESALTALALAQLLMAKVGGGSSALAAAPDLLTLRLLSVWWLPQIRKRLAAGWLDSTLVVTAWAPIAAMALLLLPLLGGIFALFAMQVCPFTGALYPLQCTCSIQNRHCRYTAVHCSTLQYGCTVHCTVHISHTKQLTEDNEWQEIAPAMHGCVLGGGFRAAQFVGAENSTGLLLYPLAPACDTAEGACEWQPLQRVLGVDQVTCEDVSGGRWQVSLVYR